MADQNTELHYLILKQLKRANLSEEDISPNKRQEWRDYLARVSRLYTDQEQERYLLERSMEISSREMRELNEKLEFAQKIARLGYWQYNRAKEQLMWSKETFNLLGLDPADGTPTLPEVMKLVHEEDREKLTSLIERAFNEGKDYEIELRCMNLKDGKYHWHYAKGHPHVNENPIQCLSGISIDITDRKIAEEEVQKMHQQLLSVSRQAGMAEVATFVLHNIGNVLNSANVSIALILEKMSKLHVEKLVKVSDLIKEHLTAQDNYFTQDEKGILVPDYLIALSSAISEEHKNINVEINNINIHLNHIKDIVALQNDISGIAGLKENIKLTEIVDLAIQMGCPSTEANQIEITKDYQFKGSIFSEKSKLLQILVNLVKNARDSVMASEVTPKQIYISIKPNSLKSTIEVIVKDNGLGISNENLMKIFTLGFTTKESGHGFGLHSSAIAAKELGGSLQADSIGLGQGAQFTIELPLSKEMNKQAKLSEIEP